EPNGTEVTAPEGTKFATATTDEEKEKAKLPADAVVLDPSKVTIKVVADNKVSAYSSGDITNTG
ncbi:hypothetical protein, partial [Lactococcus muris]|uniref:hypothetical protein n=1 Tax=Lactococcus muris TaxID=2941330 RepID=UPI00373FD285